MRTLSLKFLALVAIIVTCDFALAKTITITIDDDSTTPNHEKEIETIPAPLIAMPIVVEQVVEQVSLEPPSEDSSEPRRLIRYFCRLWKDEDYEKMYWSMTSKYRKGVSLEKFRNLFEEDAEVNGGLADENIVGKDLNKGKIYELTVELRYNNITARDKKVKAVLEKTTDGYRICDSGIIPLDLNDL